MNTADELSMSSLQGDAGPPGKPGKEGDPGVMVSTISDSASVPLIDFLNLNICSF